MPKISSTEDEVRVGLTEIDRFALQDKGYISFPHPEKPGKIVVYYMNRQKVYDENNGPFEGLRIRPLKDLPEMQSSENSGRTWSGKDPLITLYWTTERFLGGEPVDGTDEIRIRESNSPLHRR